MHPLRFGLKNSGQDTTIADLELGVTEQVIYLRGEHPVALAEKIAEMLPDLRKLERATMASG